MTIKRFALFNDTGIKIFFKSDKIFKELFVLSNIICAFVYIFIGALGQTRTGTPKRARILSPLCLPISPRGHSFVYLYLCQV